MLMRAIDGKVDERLDVVIVVVNAGKLKIVMKCLEEMDRLTRASTMTDVKQLVHGKWWMIAFDVVFALVSTVDV